MTKSTAAVCESLIGKTLIGFDTRAEVVRPAIAKIGEAMRVSAVMAGEGARAMVGEAVRASMTMGGEGIRSSTAKTGEGIR